MDKNGKEVELSKRNMKDIGHRFSGRITDDAAIRVCLELERQSEEIWRAAETLAEHAGRKTIKEEDIMKVLKLRDEL